MKYFYKGFLWISQKLGNAGLNYIIRKIHDNTTIPVIAKKTLHYINEGHSENQATIEALYDLDFISDKEIQFLRNYFDYQASKKCKNGKNHSYNSDGKCYDCGIIGCSVGLQKHFFNSDEKCYYCGIIGCSVGLQKHFFNSDGKCYYCGIIGCSFGLQKHFFNSNGKCYYCGIIGCSFGLKKHFFNSDGKCYDCGKYK